MGLETFTGTYIDGLNTSNPDGSDAKNEGDNHIRGVKLVLQNSFPGVSGAVTSTHTEINKLDGFTGVVADLNVISGGAAAGVTATEYRYLNGVTSAIQTQLTAKAAKGANSDITSLSGLTTDLTVAQGGSGRGSATAYAVLLGGTTSTGAHQSIASVGTSGQVLTSGGAGAKPSFQAAPAPSAGSVTQSKLATTTETETGGLAANHHIVSGGAYCFYPQIAHASTGSDTAGKVQMLDCSSSTLVRATSYRTLIFIDTSAAGVDITARFRYVTASPPYDMGDGDIPLFIWVIRDDKTGELQNMQVSRTPTWAYNGPTNIAADRYSGDKSYRTVWVPDGEDPETGAKRAARMSLDEKLTSEGGFQEIEITKAFKNADMDLLPHPFVGNDLTGKTVMLLDPVSDLLPKIDAFHEAGEDITSIVKKYLTIDPTPIERHAPQGVTPVAFAFK